MPSGRRCRRDSFVISWAVCALLGLPLTARAQTDDVPDPTDGKWALTTLALLEYNRELCDGIAGKVLAYWSGLSAGPDAQLDSVRRYVVDRELSNLAIGRAASDLVYDFLPDVAAEAGSETGSTLTRLYGLQVQLCDSVAYPKSGRDEFEAEVRRLLDRIEREGAELGRLLVAPEDVLDDALLPYLGHVQMAGVEAEGEYRDYLESLKPPPALPTLQDLMQAWHRSYARAVGPTKQALARYLQGRQKNDGPLIRTACRELSAAVIPLLRNERVFEAPADGVHEPLQRAFVEIKLLASECSAGRSREMETHYGAMQQQLGAASRVLAEFSLRP
ncbi:MAG: hypothetical protein GY719_20210 [bacterium]|nr:hypothetical protein [bacterium]